MELDELFIYSILPYICIVINLITLFLMVNVKKDLEEFNSNYLALQDEVYRNFIYQNTATSQAPDQDDPE